MREFKRYTVERPQMLLHIEGQAIGTIERVVVHNADFLSRESELLQLLEQKRVEIVDESTKAIESYRKVQAMQQILTEANERLELLEAENAIARQQAFEEAATICTRLAYGEYYPTGKCYQVFIPKRRQDRGDLLASAATAIRAAALKPSPLDYGSLNAAQRLAVCRGEQ